MIKSEYSYDEIVNLNKEQDMNELTDVSNPDAGLTLTVETENTVEATAPTAELTEVSEKAYPDGLMEMNRLTKDGRAIVAAQGHSKNSFKRNYDTGTATYFCRDCGATLNISVNSTAGIVGTVLTQRCTAVPAQTA